MNQEEMVKLLNEIKAKAHDAGFAYSEKGMHYLADTMYRIEEEVKDILNEAVSYENSFFIIPD